MPGAGDPTEEQPDDLVAYELVDQPVMVEGRARTKPVKAIQIGVEVGRPHRLAQRRRPPHVSEQHRHRDLGTRDAALYEPNDAVVAKLRVRGKAPEPEVTQDEPPGPSNGAAHSLQCGGLGIRRNSQRMLASSELSPMSTARSPSSDSRSVIAGL
jgi:hypothetical protein